MVAIAEDFEAEVLTVAVFKELGIQEVLVRARTEREARILALVGATRVLFVGVEMGHRLAKTLAATDVVDHVTIAEGASIIYWTADDRVLRNSREGGGRVPRKFLAAYESGEPTGLTLRRNPLDTISHVNMTMRLVGIVAA